MRHFFASFRFLPACAAILLLPALAGAASPTQEDVFRSIKSNMETTGNSSITLAVVLGAVALSIVLLIIAHRHKRQDDPQALNHPGRLMKEVGAAMDLKPEELKQLQTLANAIHARDGVTLKNPLTLLLCPSLLNGAMKKK